MCLHKCDDCTRMVCTQLSPMSPVHSPQAYVRHWQSDMNSRTVGEGERDILGGRAETNDNQTKPRIEQSYPCEVENRKHPTPTPTRPPQTAI